MPAGRKTGSANPRLGRKFGGWHNPPDEKSSFARVLKRRQRGFRNPVTPDDLARIIAASDVPVTKLPAGFAIGSTRSILD